MAGRKRLEIDERVFIELCKIQCTKKEIGAVLGVSEDTLERWCKREHDMTFSMFWGIHSEAGKASLRRSQFLLAEKNAVMAIWLGKQILGQRDEQFIKQDVAPIVIKDDIENGKENNKS